MLISLGSADGIDPLALTGAAVWTGSSYANISIYRYFNLKLRHPHLAVWKWATCFKLLRLQEVKQVLLRGQSLHPKPLHLSWGKSPPASACLPPSGTSRGFMWLSVVQWMATEQWQTWGETRSNRGHRGTPHSDSPQQHELQNPSCLLVSLCFSHINCYCHSEEGEMKETYRYSGN